MDDSDDLVAALAPVVDAFRALAIRYYVGGSVASSFHGATRATMDVDLVCELEQHNVEALLEAVGDAYYVSAPAARDAVRDKGCFNLIHLPTSFKIDVFVSRGRPRDVESMERAVVERLGEAVCVEAPIATAEDVIISKLEWFRLTDETSERQWEDVSRLMDLHGDALDRAYLHRAAQSVQIEDLLDRLLRR